MERTRCGVYRAGWDAISKLLGHSSLATTIRYGYHNDPTLRDAVAGLDAPSLAGKK